MGVHDGSSRATPMRPMVYLPALRLSAIVSMFAVGRDHENACEQVKIRNIPHIEFLDDRQRRISLMVNTR